MGEFFFVAKCFILAMLLTVFMQTNVGSETIETRAVDWLHSGTVPRYLRTVSEGAVKVIYSGYKSTSTFVTEKLESTGATEKASRLHFQFKRPLLLDSKAEEK